MKKSLKIVLGAMGVLVLAALVGLLTASSRVSAKLNERYASHELQLQVPNPLGADELPVLREERSCAASTWSRRATAAPAATATT